MSYTDHELFMNALRKVKPELAEIYDYTKQQNLKNNKDLDLILEDFTTVEDNIQVSLNSHTKRDENGNT